jgi:hypothetical protein
VGLIRALAAEGHRVGFGDFDGRFVGAAHEAVGAGEVDADLGTAVVVDVQRRG